MKPHLARSEIPLCLWWCGVKLCLSHNYKLKNAKYFIGRRNIACHPQVWQAKWFSSYKQALKNIDLFEWTSNGYLHYLFCSYSNLWYGCHVLGLIYICFLGAPMSTTDAPASKSSHKELKPSITFCYIFSLSFHSFLAYFHLSVKQPLDAKWKKQT